MAQLRTLRSAVADGRLSKKEVSALITEARRGGITADEKDQVREAVRRAPPTTAESRQALVQAFGADVFAPVTQPPNPQPPVVQPPTPSPRRRLADPVLFAEPQPAVWRPTPGVALIDGATADDIEQGRIGTCFVLSALASFAEAHPGELEKRITDNGDGTFDVSFRRGRYAQREGGGWDWKVEPFVVTVDDDLPVDAQTGALAYGHSKTQGELWVALFEKAYASMWQSQGGYGLIGRGGSAADVFRALDGGMYLEALTPSSMTEPELTARLRRNLQNDVPMTAGTPPDLAETTGLVKRHACSVLGLTQRNGETMVQLRNPWGRHEPGNDGRDDGRFELPMRLFRQHFSTLYE